jgi:hypothetical protein
MWRRRLRHSELLEQRSAKAEQERQDLRDTLTAFEAIARAAGVHLGSAEPGVVSEVPPSVIAAASAPRPGGLPVVVDVGARRVVAVTGPARDPREWMPSIAAAASLPTPAGQVTRIERAPMPAGLLAAAVIPRARRPAVRLAGQIRGAEPVRRHRPAHRRQRGRRRVPDGLYRDTLTAAGGMAVRVADTLSAAQARRAAVAAVTAARRNGWEASQTAAIIPVVAAAAGWYATAIPVRAAIFTGVATVTATAAGVAISVLPGHPVVPPVRVRSLPAQAVHVEGHTHHHDRDRRRASHLIADSAPVTPAPTVSPSHIPAQRQTASAKPDRTKPPGRRRSASPSPQPTTSAAPSPTPSPSPSPSSSAAAGECVGVVIIKVCATL